MARRRRRSRSHGTDQGGAGGLELHGRATLSAGSRCALSPPVVVASLAPMSAPPSLVPSAAVAKKDLEQKLSFMGGQVPPAPTPGSHEAAVAAAELASTLEDGFVDPLMSRCCPMDKEMVMTRETLVHFNRI
ncbi:hypothetical protein OsI_10751 [Oryza sativa Indica Group]|uniref:Uncharacterized protein n=1 Tax=Oryza sativa subsp. indica TaxID=39946 RepID=A2XEJ4_ORYSI|nr:hypothetical protein OsI_10751 [Oryza sativa Indica Group]